MLVAGPILLASLFAGLAVGVVQAATQINEASVSFVVKVGAVVAVDGRHRTGARGEACSITRAPASPPSSTWFIDELRERRPRVRGHVRAHRGAHLGIRSDLALSRSAGLQDAAHRTGRGARPRRNLVRQAERRASSRSICASVWRSRASSVAASSSASDFRSCT